MITIENDNLKASINFKGAELTSLVKKSSETEYIWQADPHFWSRHAPVLFPIVGRLKNDEFIHLGSQYSLTQHGFARDLEFECIDQKIEEATFKLSSNRETRLAYPFKFHLFVHYKLNGNRLEVHYEVENKDPNDLYFSIGAHPAFNCPLRQNEKRSDYALIFNQEEDAETQMLDGGLRTGETKHILNNSREIEIQDTLFDDDALIFSQLESTEISLQKGAEKLVTVHFDGWPYLGIWSKNREAPFVCIEPWYGIADRQNHNYEFSEKEGLIALESKAKFFAKYEIEIH
jgi:galactose mutarotase-like enzyme